MKELSIEEKAKRYDEVIEELRGLLEGIHEEKCEILEEDITDIFPELKESEDERIRKEIIEAFKTLGDGKIPVVINYADIFTWLEKQGKEDSSIQQAYEWGYTEGKRIERKHWVEKQKFSEDYNSIDPQFGKPINKVEPKFKVGDWVVRGKLVTQITSIENDGYTNSDQGFISFETAKKFHLWTIQDAKDGDVLVNGSNIFIFHFINDTRLMGYCHVNLDDGRFYDDIGKNECFCLIDAVVTPATKEQRDLLFQKMKEAGYEWDEEKKELKKIEDEEYDGKDYGIDGLWHAMNILEKTLGKVNGYQTDDGFLSHQCAITAVKKLYKQKPTETVKWSAQEEYCICELEAMVKEAWRKAENVRNDVTIKKMQELMFFLKTLNPDKKPQRMISAEAKEAMYDKPDWSEEDEEFLRRAINATKDVYPMTANWLKSLKERCTWKPSDEQMHAFEQVYDWYNNNFAPSETLTSLYNDLEKLKGE